MFKIGDLVKRTTAPLGSYRDMRIGDIDTIVDIRGGILVLHKFGTGHDVNNFQLVTITTKKRKFL